jgi:hypothetical protein
VDDSRRIGQHHTSPTDYFPIKQMQMARFDGKAWALMGNLINQH